MNSEKVKEIKKALEYVSKTNYDRFDYEGKNEWKVMLFADILTLINELESENEYQKEHIEMWFRKNEEKKDRIAELEEYIKGNEQDAKAFVNGWHKDLETELKKFAEKLKIKCVNKIHETLKEFIK